LLQSLAAYWKGKERMQAAKGFKIGVVTHFEEKQFINKKDAL